MPPISGGAAAAVLCPGQWARDFHPQPVRVLGSGHATGPATLWEMEEITSFPATLRAGREAYASARMVPADAQVGEVHDCFTIAEIIATEDLGPFAGSPGNRVRQVVRGGSLAGSPWEACSARFSPPARGNGHTAYPIRSTANPGGTLATHSEAGRASFPSTQTRRCRR